ncbi:Myb-like DNA-binding domain [Carpediemonas membranifera]|uniref:Myb-like DNA-binding domain n=1 Tax=Carpediemonas membranifera TaxID=201153 RepID=A0A8J6BWY8_9EUKA|nr:Myb-like DNA-binding domain [Carpediemonas membranifera]|eukprot:KAG9392901.1 Myb-like DNA-binding domain [Carpediemonas membranifera]
MELVPHGMPQLISPFSPTTSSQEDGDQSFITPGRARSSSISATIDIIPQLQLHDEAASPATSNDPANSIPCPCYATTLAPTVMSSTPKQAFVMPTLPPPEIQHTQALDAERQLAQKKLTSSHKLMTKAEFQRTQEAQYKPSARNRGKPGRRRLIWTPELHERFVDSLGQLGIRSAVPKSILQLLNVEGITRESIASRLQKTRQYVRSANNLPDGVALENYHLTPTLLEQVRKADFGAKARAGVF